MPWAAACQLSALRSSIDGQGLENDAGGERQDLAILIQPEQAGQGGAGLHGRLQAGLAGTRIGDAGIDHQGPDFRLAGQMLAAHLHRGCTEAVLGEHAGHGGTGVQGDHGQVAPIGLADTGFGSAEADTGNGEQGFGGRRGVIDGHESLTAGDKRKRRG